MKLQKTFNYTGSKETTLNDYLKSINTDLTNLSTWSKGRVRFGTATNGYRGENISGEYRTYAATTTGGQSIAHTLGYVPTGMILTGKTGYGDIYMSTSSATSATLVSTTTAVTYTLFLLK